MHNEPHAKKRKLGNGQSIKVVAFLGPTGTYGHRAATCFIRYLELEGAELKPCKTMSATYREPTAQYIVLPIENTIHGVVRETLDCLLSGLSRKTDVNDAVKAPKIIADLVMPVRHALVASKSATLADITAVRSHEQALGQCSGWLKSNLPRSELVSWSSTAAAAASIFGASGASDPATVAAICSPSADTLENGALKVLARDIQDYPDNFTRFLLLSRDADSPPTLTASSESLTLSPSRHFYALSDWSKLPNVSAHHPAISSIHTRPMEIIPPAAGSRPPGGAMSTKLSRDQTGCWQWALIEVEAGDASESEHVTDVQGALYLGTIDRRITSQEVLDSEYEASQSLDTLGQDA